MLIFVIHNGLLLLFSKMILGFWKSYECIAQHCVRTWPETWYLEILEACGKIRASLKTELFSVNNSYKCPSKQIHWEALFIS